MAGPTPYLFFAGTTREALSTYRDIFGGTLNLHTRAQMQADGDPEEIQHGELSGPVQLFAADATEGQPPLATQGLMFALLGTADAATMTEWFDALAAGGEVLDPLTTRPWGDTDGQVRDRYGVHWLIGFQH